MGFKSKKKAYILNRYIYPCNQMLPDIARCVKKLPDIARCVKKYDINMIIQKTTTIMA